MKCNNPNLNSSISSPPNIIFILKFLQKHKRASKEIWQCINKPKKTFLKNKLINISSTAVSQIQTYLELTQPCRWGNSTFLSKRKLNPLNPQNDLHTEIFSTIRGYTVSKSEGVVLWVLMAHRCLQVWDILILLTYSGPWFLLYHRITGSLWSWKFISL